MSEPARSQHLIVQTAFLGDLLLGIPLLKTLRHMRPQDKFVLLCRKGLGEFFLKSGLVDEVVEVDKKVKNSWRSAALNLRARQFDSVISPHLSFRTALFVWRLKAKHKVGYARFFNFFIFNERVSRPMALPEALRQLALLAPFNKIWKSRLAEFEDSQTSRGGLGRNGELMAVPEWADMTVNRLVQIRKNFRTQGSLQGLQSNQTRRMIEDLKITTKDKIAFLAPGSVWATKMWTTEGYAGVARDLLNKGYRVFVTGTVAESDICDAVVKLAPGIVSLAGATSLYGSVEWLALADLLVCNDSGAMHMAAAAGVPTVSIFGPTILEFGYRPWQTHAKVVQTDLPCRPCGKHGTQVCPIGTHDCMKKVSSQMVSAVISDLIACSASTEG